MSRIRLRITITARAPAMTAVLRVPIAPRKRMIEKIPEPIATLAGTLFCPESGLTCRARGRAAFRIARFTMTMTATITAKRIECKALASSIPGEAASGFSESAIAGEAFSAKATSAPTREMNRDTGFLDRGSKTRAILIAVAEAAPRRVIRFLS